MTNLQNTVSIGEAATRCGITVKQIRHWQDQRYIPDENRVICGERAFRQFTEDNLRLIKAIAHYREEGFVLPVAAQKAADAIKSGKGGKAHAKEK